MLTLDEYQKQAATTDKSPGEEAYYALGLNGEAGEVAELVKKKWRKTRNGIPVDLVIYKDNMRGELGDVLWYLARQASKCDLSLDEIAQANLVKLNRRLSEGRLV